MYTLFKCKLERRKDMKIEKDYLDTLFEFYGIESAPNQKDGIWIKGENGELEPFDCLKNFQDIFFPTAQNQEETFSFKDLKNFKLAKRESYNIIYKSLSSILSEQFYKDSNKREYSEAA